MGASTFYTVARGDTAECAFASAVRSARNDHGRAGYTGTIAEKHWFHLFTMPAGVDLAHFVGAVKEAGAAAGRVAHGIKAEAVFELSSALAPHAALVRRMGELHRDKEEDAVAIDTGNGVFVFFGYARC